MTSKIEYDIESVFYIKPLMYKILAFTGEISILLYAVEANIEKIDIFDKIKKNDEIWCEELLIRKPSCGALYEQYYPEGSRMCIESESRKMYNFGRHEFNCFNMEYGRLQNKILLFFDTRLAEPDGFDYIRRFSYINSSYFLKRKNKKDIKLNHWLNMNREDENIIEYKIDNICDKINIEIMSRVDIDLIYQNMYQDLLERNSYTTQTMQHGALKILTLVINICDEKINFSMDKYKNLLKYCEPCRIEIICYSDKMSIHFDFDKEIKKMLKYLKKKPLSLKIAVKLSETFKKIYTRGTEFKLQKSDLYHTQMNIQKNLYFDKIVKSILEKTIILDQMLFEIYFEKFIFSVCENHFQIYTYGYFDSGEAKFMEMCKKLLKKNYKGGYYTA